MNELFIRKVFFLIMVIRNGCLFPGVNGIETALNDDLVKKSVLEWWKNVSNPNIVMSSLSNQLAKACSPPFQLPKFEMKSFICKHGIKPSSYMFHSKGEFGLPEGKGKIVFIQPSDLSSWSQQRRDEFNRNNVCYSFSKYGSKTVKDVVGTFRKGLIDKRARIRWNDDSISISRFEKGVMHGVHRHWDKEGNLLSVHEYHFGIKIGLEWKMEHEHLFFTEKTFLKGNGSKYTLIFPLFKNGKLGYPMSGIYYPHLNVLENASSVSVTGMTSNSSNTVLKLKYEFSGAQQSRYALRSKSTHSNIMYTKSPYCGKNATLFFANPSEGLHQYFIDLDQIIYQNFSTTEMYEGYRILWHLKPILDNINDVSSIQLISKITMGHGIEKWKASVLGSPAITIIFEEIGLDQDKKLNGYCQIRIPNKETRSIPRDNTFNWVPIRISGMFQNGQLNGTVLIETDTLGSGWAIVKNGVMHGPVVFQGIQPVSRVILKLFIVLKFVILFCYNDNNIECFKNLVTS